MIDARSKELRRLILIMIEAGRRGHIGPAASLVEVLRVMFDSWLNFRPDQPDWPDRDRLILSKGHGCLALYALLADYGFIGKHELSEFCASSSRLGGHPEILVPGVEASTGALGHGLPIGVGFALAARLRRQHHRVAVVVGDGEINEGSTWEAALSASKHGLSNLIVFVDYNKLQSYGATDDVLPLEPLRDKWEAFGFQTREVDGHDLQALEEVMATVPFEPHAPSAVICHTVKGKGFPMAENQPEWHHKSRLSDTDLAALYQCLE